ncbi:MAG: hypothetical protein KDA41_19670, partial [Planctomycetales bacterium]|nr:hypothetical protein [Planctomycetales bacterium]
EGLIAADKMLASDAPSYYKQYAILAYARLGSREHVAKVEKLLDDETVCTTHRVNDTEYQTQFRDIALAVALHLYGQDPKAFGFDRLARHSQYVFSSYSLGFEDDAKRQAAFDQWHAFRREQDERRPPAN